MVQCLEGVKLLLSAVMNFCDSETYKQPNCLGHAEALARETVCMSLCFLSWTLQIFVVV